MSATLASCQATVLYLDDGGGSEILRLGRCNIRHLSSPAGLPLTGPGVCIIVSVLVLLEGLVGSFELGGRILITNTGACILEDVRDEYFFGWLWYEEDQGNGFDEVGRKGEPAQPKELQ